MIPSFSFLLAKVMAHSISMSCDILTVRLTFMTNWTYDLHSQLFHIDIRHAAIETKDSVNISVPLPSIASYLHLILSSSSPIQLGLHSWGRE